MIKVYIDAEEVTLKPNTLNISGKIEERETCSFNIVDMGENRRFYKGQQVTIEQDDVVRFTGTLLSSNIVEATKQGDRWHQIRATGHHYAAGKRLAAKVYEETRAGDIVRDLVDSYLADEGIMGGYTWRFYEGQTWNEVVESANS